MKKALQFIAAPGVPYPIGAVAHAVVGAAIGCLPAQLDGVGDPSHGALIGALVGVVVGFVAWVASK